MCLLTIGVTICKRSNISKVNYLLLSLFDAETTCELFADTDQCEQLRLKYTTDSCSIENMKLISPTKHVEIIIVQDGKNEALTSCVKSLIKVYQKHINNVSFKFILNNESQSVSVSRNVVINLAKGDYVKLCDDDDLSVNANELINIINQYRNMDYIECCLTNFTKQVKHVIYTGWFPTNVIVSTHWLRNNKLYFVPKVVGEDSIWRFDIYYMFKISPINSVNIKVIPKSIYFIYWKSNKTTSKDDDKHFNEMMIRAFNHEKQLFGKIPINPFMFLIISNMVFSERNIIKVSDYVLMHSDDFEFKELIDETNKLRQKILKQSIPFQSKTRLEQIRVLYDKYYSTYSEEQFNNFRKIYGAISSAISNEQSKVFKLSNKFTTLFNDGYYLRTYIHMNKRKGTHELTKNDSHSIYHEVIENINSSNVSWLLTNEQNEFNINNSIFDDSLLKTVKYAFTPYSLFIWLMFNVNVNTKTTIVTNNDNNNELLINNNTNKTQYFKLKLLNILYMCIIILNILIICYKFK